MKIGLFGGTFNPIHNGHLILAENIVNIFNLDKIFFIPAGDPPHKKVDIDKMHRYFMTILAIQNNKKFEISTAEIDGKNKYSFETINYFKKLYKKDEIFFIMGLDSLNDIEKWKKGLALLDMCNFIIVNRFYANQEDKIKNYNDLKFNKNKFCDKKNLFFIENFNIDISSTEIRNSIKNNSSIKYLVPQQIENYIFENKLYK